MIVLPHNKAAFLHIPKTGGDSVSKFLINNIPGATHSGGGKHWPVWMHPSVPNGWYTFAFVREPVAWYRSFYSFIMNNYITPYGHYPIFEAGQYHPMRQWEIFPWNKWKPGSTEDFNSFVLSVFANDPAYYTRLLEWMLGPEDAKMVNFIGKQENLSHNLSLVLDRMGYKEQAVKAAKKTPRVNTSQSKFTVAQETIELIHAHEYSTYRRFGYNK